MRAGIAFGANLGDRLASLTTARAQVCIIPGVHPPLLTSSLYETDPVECEAGAARFLNGVMEIGYHGEAHALLEALQEVEQRLGRPVTHAANRSRTIDLDLLYHGAQVFDEARLTLPHPRLRFRAFVLHPLAEIRPNLILPNESRTVQQLAEELPPARGVVRLPVQW